MVEKHVEGWIWPEWASVLAVLLMSAVSHVITAIPMGKKGYLTVISPSMPHRLN